MPVVPRRAWASKDMAAEEIRAYLSHLAVAGKWAASTQNVAFSALLFLYRDVLHVNLPTIEHVQRAQRPARLPEERKNYSYPAPETPNARTPEHRTPNAQRPNARTPEHPTGPRSCAVNMDKGSEGTQLLEARELIDMRLAARMVVLSACDTGQGQHSGGEGLLGLTWAFRAAGCPSTVASLWSVDDAATGQLMVRFYQALKAGKRKDAALREAMLEVKQGKTSPVYWAAFQVNGDTSSVKL